MGNASGHKKLNTPELRLEAYRQYCEHISQGFSKESWAFEHPTDSLMSLTHQTMEKYIREEPALFPPILMKLAQALSFKHWESEGKKLMRGEYKGGSPVVWQTFMRNKFGWDKETFHSHSVEPEARLLLKRWETLSSMPVNQNLPPPIPQNISTVVELLPETKDSA